jgi:hypothetical protein
MFQGYIFASYLTTTLLVFWLTSLTANLNDNPLIVLLAMLLSPIGIPFYLIGLWLTGGFHVQIWTLIFLGFWNMWTIPKYLRSERKAVASHRAATGLCVNCGYDLRGNITFICPECGWSFRVVQNVTRPPPSPAWPEITE